jgi:phage terminase large subunit GpA-like protein
MRSASICVLLKDEIDAWPDTVGKDGCPDVLTDARCSGYWSRRKIFRGSTPLLKGTSKIEKAYQRGDKRKYTVLCKACSFPQVLRWRNIDEKTGLVGGFQWELEDGALLLESVRYCCLNCGEPHYEFDKENLFSKEHGAKWVPTARPVEPNIRSYHLPALYSPIGMQPWYKCVSDFLKVFDTETNKVKDVGGYQVFHNNILAEPFEQNAVKIGFMSVSAHRRAEYRFGQIPNKFAANYSGSHILFLTCQIDVHKKNLAVAVMGWTRDACCYVIDYQRYESTDKKEDCTDLSSEPWQKVRDLIEEKEYIADDGKKYRIILTFIDAGYSNATVVKFCDGYETSVFPILGRDTAAKNQSIKEFGEFKTQSGTTGFKILVDHYKDRLSTVLRRSWSEEEGPQKPYHFNAPVDLSDKQLKELTVEKKKEKIGANGEKTYYWHRPGGAANELWDLLCYGHAAVEVLAWDLCIKHYEVEKVDWVWFWDHLEAQQLYYTCVSV